MENIGQALTQYAADYMRKASERADQARDAAQPAVDKTESAKVYSAEVATNFEFFQPVIDVETFRCPKCWMEDNQDNPLRSVDEVASTFHCDACGKDFSSEFGEAGRPG